LKALVDDKAKVIEGWIAAGKLAPVDPHHLIFMIWAATQHYADFDAQVRAVLGERASAPDFADKAAEAVLAVILGGVKAR
ncbi:MAG TPA: TetR family transcriptional regulator C-terminal domain-containing protein, partial [Rhizobiaceae bacterium]|nr:TetR family transcriptional regulator C-terminal domain-containing protein [Rhizobiaceae bacterium]